MSSPSTISLAFLGYLSADTLRKMKADLQILKNQTGFRSAKGRELEKLLKRIKESLGDED